MDESSPDALRNTIGCGVKLIKFISILLFDTRRGVRPSLLSVAGTTPAVNHTLTIWATSGPPIRSLTKTYPNLVLANLPSAITCSWNQEDKKVLTSISLWQVLPGRFRPKIVTRYFPFVIVSSPLSARRGVRPSLLSVAGVGPAVNCSTSYRQLSPALSVAGGAMERSGVPFFCYHLFHAVQADSTQNQQADHCLVSLSVGVSAPPIPLWQRRAPPLIV